MSKKVIAIAATLAVIIALGVTLLILQNQPEPEGEPYTPIESIYVFGGPTAQETPTPILITVENEHGSYTLRNNNPDGAKSADDYTLLGFEGIRLDAYQVLGVADRVTGLTAKSVVVEDGANLAEFGLDKPSVRVSAEYADNSSATLLLGNKAPGDNGMYAMREGNPAVYLLYQTSADYFIAGALQMLDKTITTGDPTATTFSRVVLGGSVRTEEIVIEETPETQTEVGGYVLHTHAIVSPTKNGLHITRGLEPLMKVFALSALEVVGKLDQPSDLAKWGLDNPYSTILVQSLVEGTFKLLVSAPDADGNVHIVREDVPVVYLVSKESLPWLTLDSFTMMDKMLILPFIDTVETVTVWTPQQEIVIKLEGVDDNLLVSVNGAPYEDVKNFRSFYQTLIAASYEAYTEDPLPENARLLLRYTYAYRDSSVRDVVSFYEGASRKVFAQLNDNSPMYAMSSYVDRVLSDLAKFLAAESVTPYL